MAGRKNPTTYVERHAESIREGEAPQAEQPEQHDLEKPERQQEIIHPATLELSIPHFDEEGEHVNTETVSVRTKLTPKDVFQKNILNALHVYVQTALIEAGKLSGDTQVNGGDWFLHNAPYITTVGYKENCMREMAHVLSILTDKPAKLFLGLDLESITKASTLLLTLYAAQISGDKQPKKDAKPKLQAV